VCSKALLDSQGLADFAIVLLVSHVMGWILGPAAIVVAGVDVGLGGRFLARMVHHVRRSGSRSPRVVVRICIRILFVSRNLRNHRTCQKRKGDCNYKHLSYEHICLHGLMLPKLRLKSRSMA
jgi:hypothetical protein